MEIFPEAIGLFFVLSTFLSKFLSTISLTMHPADLIKTEPTKKKKEYLKKVNISPLKSYAIVNPHRHGQNNSIKPIGFFNLVNSINRFKCFIRIYL